jgi:hypothetical protein
MVRITAMAILLLLAVALFPLTADTGCVPEISPASLMDVRHGIPLSGFTSRLIQNPQPVTAVIFADNLYGEPGFWGWIDFHALYPIELKYFAQSISDVPTQTRYIPHVTESYLLCYENSDPVYIRQKSRLTFDYFIYKTFYAYIVEAFMGKSVDGNAFYEHAKTLRVADAGG